MKSLLRVIAYLSLCISLNSYSFYYGQNIIEYGDICGYSNCGQNFIEIPGESSPPFQNVAIYGVNNKLFFNELSGMVSFPQFSTNGSIGPSFFNQMPFTLTTSNLSIATNNTNLESSLTPNGNFNIQIPWTWSWDWELNIDNVIYNGSEYFTSLETHAGRLEYQNGGLFAILDGDASPENEPIIWSGKIGNEPMFLEHNIWLDGFEESFYVDTSPVPLPAGIYLFLSGLVGLGLMRGRNA